MHFGLATLSLASCAPTLAQSVAAQAGAETLARRCAALGGRPREAAGLVRAIQIGGREASALDSRRLTCEGASTVDCGPFGCKLSIYFDGVAPAFEIYVKAWRARAGKLEIVRVGAYCATSGESCSETYQASGDGLTLAARGQAKFERDPMPRLAASTPRRARARAADVAAEKRRADAPEPSTGAHFDPTAPKSEPVTSPAPSAIAERRRKLDAAPYVP